MNRFIAPEVLDDEYTANLYELEDVSHIPNCRKIALMQSLNNIEKNNNEMLATIEGVKSSLEGMRESFDKLVGVLNHAS